MAWWSQTNIEWKERNSHEGGGAGPTTLQLDSPLSFIGFLKKPSWVELSRTVTVNALQVTSVMQILSRRCREDSGILQMALDLASVDDDLASVEDALASVDDDLAPEEDVLASAEDDLAPVEDGISSCLSRFVPWTLFDLSVVVAAVSTSIRSSNKLLTSTADLADLISLLCSKWVKGNSLGLFFDPGGRPRPRTGLPIPLALTPPALPTPPSRSVFSVFDSSDFTLLSSPKLLFGGRPRRRLNFCSACFLIWSIRCIDLLEDVCLILIGDITGALATGVGLVFSFPSAELLDLEELGVSTTGSISTSSSVSSSVSSELLDSVNSVIELLPALSSSSSRHKLFWKNIKIHLHDSACPPINSKARTDRRPWTHCKM